MLFKHQILSFNRIKTCSSNLSLLLLLLLSSLSSSSSSLSSLLSLYLQLTEKKNSRTPNEIATTYTAALI